MALFNTLQEAELYGRQQVAAKVWVVAHAARSITGQIIVRFQRFMSPSNPAAGGWEEEDNYPFGS